MIAYWLRKAHDSADGGTLLERREQPVPQATAGKMLVRMRAASLNRGDLMARIKRHGAADGRPAGVDGAGEVVDAGSSEFKVGERVMFRTHGCFAEYALVDPALTARVPACLSWEEAGSILAAFITGWEAIIQFGRLRAGDWLLLAGASP